MKIELDGDSKFALVWENFDGDDGFDNHYVEFYENEKHKRYEFGACASIMYRKVVSFFENNSSTEIGLGFRNPDIIQYNIKRINGGFQFIVDYQASNEKFQHSLTGNCLTIDKSFINEHYE